VTRLAIVLAMAGTIGCSRSQSVVSTNVSQGDFQESAVTAVITGALEGEAAGQPTDTLFTSSALIVVNGRVRSAPPLFAGIGQGGQVIISSSQLQIRPATAWSAVDYRWQSRDGVAREGRATFVLTQLAPGRWQIQHVHSSSPQ
jgi:hypothetical protein